MSASGEDRAASAPSPPAAASCSSSAESFSAEDTWLERATCRRPRLSSTLRTREEVETAGGDELGRRGAQGREEAARGQRRVGRGPRAEVDGALLGRMVRVSQKMRRKEDADFFSFALASLSPSLPRRISSPPHPPHRAPPSGELRLPTSAAPRAASRSSLSLSVPVHLFFGIFEEGAEGQGEGAAAPTAAPCFAFREGERGGRVREPRRASEGGGGVSRRRLLVTFIPRNRDDRRESARRRRSGFEEGPARHGGDRRLGWTKVEALSALFGPENSPRLSLDLRIDTKKWLSCSNTRSPPN